MIHTGRKTIEFSVFAFFNSICVLGKRKPMDKGNIKKNTRNGNVGQRFSLGIIPSLVVCTIRLDAIGIPRFCSSYKDEMLNSMNGSRKADSINVPTAH